MTDKLPLRRPAFDAIADGWGSDKRADLGARLALLREFEEEFNHLTPAENKIACAMLRRYAVLDGATPSRS